MSHTFLAVDLGATSGRVIAGILSDGKVELRQIARFPNGPVKIGNHFHWDIAALYEAVKAGLAEALKQYPEAISIGVDSWGVDYSLLSGENELRPPFHYRDAKNFDGVKKVFGRISEFELYQKNGLQFLPFNTIFQLAADSFEQGKLTADSLLLIPDYFNYKFTGKKTTELTNASTTGLIGVDSNAWSDELIELAGAPKGIFQPIVQPGEYLGNLIGKDIKVVSVASHDTASAVVATPIGSSSAYISCGTWGLVGLELEQPVVTEAAKAANFTNERGIDSTYRFLHNVMGLWLLNETISFWKLNGDGSELQDLLVVAAKEEAKFTPFDVNDSRFLEPGNMPERISAWYQEQGLAGPETKSEMVFTILNSIAARFAQAVAKAQELSGVEITELVMVGGGAQNQLLCQLTADFASLPVVTGPVEATALGNILVQAAAAGVIPYDRAAMREVTKRSFEGHTYLPKQ